MKTKSILPTIAGLLVLGAASGANAQVFQATSVAAIGCNDGDFGFHMQRTGFDGGTYTRHTVVTSGGLTYMNEDVTGNVSDGTNTWGLFDTSNYGPVASPGAWPIPAGQPVTIDFIVERPLGTVLTTWRTVIDGCDTGAITSNAQIVPAPVPTLSEWAMILFGLLLAGGAAVTLQRRRMA